MSKRVELASVAAEYSYLQVVSCDRCGGPTTAQRHGARGEKGRMIDQWGVTCTRCGSSSILELSVPAPDLAQILLAAEPGAAQRRKPGFFARLFGRR